MTQLSQESIKKTVSLFTREWIEIAIMFTQALRRTQSPSLRGSGLKSLDGLAESVNETSPSLRGSGLKSR